MKDSLLIFRKEWKGFTRSNRGIFLIYGALVIMWSFLISSNINLNESNLSYLWLVFFSVIITGNFSNTTFISERLAGSLEILLTSGISRLSILMGKIVFVVIMSAVLGSICYTFAFFIEFIQIKRFDFEIFKTSSFWQELLLYFGACYINTTSSAWLSCKLSNPRLIHFINFFLLGIVITIHALLSELMVLSILHLTIALIITGLFLNVMAHKSYKSEKVIQPLIL
jgi:ABC-type Na+ efflux pump permease subunit